MEELTYYLIEAPFKKGRIVVTDRHSLSQILENYENVELKKTFHITAEDRGKIYDSSRGEKVLEAENYLQKMYKEDSGSSLGLAAVFLGTGITLTYFFFKPLFDAGAYALPRFRVESAYKTPLKELPPEVINNPDLIDSGGRFFSKVAGFGIGALPFLGGLAFGVKHFMDYRKYKRFSKKMEELKALELEIVPDEDLSSFQKESEGLINEMREYGQKFLSTESGQKRVKICRKIESGLRRMSCLSKTYGLEEVSSYYVDLEESFSELIGILKEPRFWKNEKKHIKELFGGKK